MFNRMQRLWSVFTKYAREQKRDLWMLGLSLAFAPLFVLIYYAMTGATGSTTYGVLVINQDTGAAGNEIIAGMAGFTYQNGSPFLRVERGQDRPQAETRLRNREAALLIIIPPDFSQAIAAMETSQPIQTSLTFIGDLTNPYYTVAAVTAMTVADNYLQMAAGGPRPIGLVEIPLGASAARTEFENYVPGLIVLSVILMIFQAAMMAAREVESGTLRRLRLSRLTSFELLGGLTGWMMVIAIGEVLLTFATATACGFRSNGQLGIAILVGIITSLSVIGAGLIVACFAKTVAHAFVIANFPLGFFMFLTGGAFPMPKIALFTVAGRTIGLADILPPTHAVVALNKIFTLGVGLDGVAYELTASIVLSLLYFAVGVWLFQRTQMRPKNG